MKSILAALLLIPCLALAARAADADQHLLYFTSPDGAQGGGSGTGILIFDINNGHQFVRRIEIPSFKEGVRGVCASAVTKRLYATTSLKRIVCMDLLTDKIIWEKVYETGCDRLNITPDGKTLYVPSGFWSKDKKPGWMVIDAIDGNVIAHITTPAASHNTVISLDGQRAFLASNSWLTVVDTKTNATIHDIETGSKAQFPLTANSDRSRVYVCLGREIGFQIIEPEAGKILATVFPDGDHIARRTHGVGLTPDEKEIWISDQGGNAVYVFDNTQNPPKQTAKLSVSKGGHGWIGFSLDGRFGYTSSVEIFDVKEKKVVATFKDEHGTPVSSSKFVEVVFRGKDVIATGDQFGVGRLHTPEKPAASAQ